MKRKSFIALLILCTTTFFLSTGMLIHNDLDAKRQVESYNQLISIVENVDLSDIDVLPFDEDSDFIAKYQELHKQKGDMVGWIKIDDTQINYPVMQTIENPNYYLRRGFDKNYSLYGCPYVQETCDISKPSDNIVIYGHHMNDGSMFANLMKYTKKSFWEKHKTITFDTLNKHSEYEVFATFKTTAYGDDSTSFKYYRFVEAKDEQEFNSFIDKCKELALYDTGITPNMGIS